MHISVYLHVFYVSMTDVTGSIPLLMDFLAVILDDIIRPIVSVSVLTWYIIDYNLGICCFFAKHAAFRRKSKDGLSRNRDNVPECCDMSICGHLLKIQRVGLVQSGPHHHLIET